MKRKNGIQRNINRLLKMREAKRAKPAGPNRSKWLFKINKELQVLRRQIKRIEADDLIMDRIVLALNEVFHLDREHGSRSIRKRTRDSYVILARQFFCKYVLENEKIRPIKISEYLFRNERYASNSRRVATKKIVSDLSVRNKWTNFKFIVNELKQNNEKDTD